MLAARARGAEDVHAQVLFLDVDVDIHAGVGVDVDRSERGVAASRGVEGRDADQSVDALFRGEQAVGVGPGDLEGDAFDAGLVAGEEVELLDVEMLALGPAAVHAQEHLGPVLCLGAARAGMDFQDGVGVVLGAEKGRELCVGQVAVQGLDLLGQGVEHFGAAVFLGHGQPFVEVGAGGEELFPAFDLGGERAFFTQDRGQAFGRVPGSGLGQFGLYFGQAVAALLQVKDASRIRRIW